LISCGVRSGEWLLDPVAREAKVFARPLNSCAVDEVGVVGEAGPELENAGCDCDRLAEVPDSYDIERDVIGTVKLLRLASDDRNVEEACEPVRAISGGTSSAAGIGKPRAAAASCASVHDSE
jgi:hypothetical protein